MTKETISKILPLNRITACLNHPTATRHTSTERPQDATQARPGRQQEVEAQTKTSKACSVAQDKEEEALSSLGFFIQTISQLAFQFHAMLGTGKTVLHDSLQRAMLYRFPSNRVGWKQWVGGELFQKGGQKKSPLLPISWTRKGNTPPQKNQVSKGRKTRLEFFFSS